jgi:hypothetical protein
VERIAILIDQDRGSTSAPACDVCSFVLICPKARVDGRHSTISGVRESPHRRIGREGVELPKIFAIYRPERLGLLELVQHTRERFNQGGQNVRLAETDIIIAFYDAAGQQWLDLAV